VNPTPDHAAGRNLGAVPLCAVDDDRVLTVADWDDLSFHSCYHNPAGNKKSRTISRYFSLAQRFFMVYDFNHGH
jgi:hypothetical protein